MSIRGSCSPSFTPDRRWALLRPVPHAQLSTLDRPPPLPFITESLIPNNHDPIFHDHWGHLLRPVCPQLHATTCQGNDWGRSIHYRQHHYVRVEWSKWWRFCFLGLGPCRSSGKYLIALTYVVSYCIAIYFVLYCIALYFVLYCIIFYSVFYYILYYIIFCIVLYIVLYYRFVCCIIFWIVFLVHCIISIVLHCTALLVCVCVNALVHCIALYRSSHSETIPKNHRNH